MYGFFFFQAEDGIRDSSVTGVQTCALPILGRGYENGRNARHAQDPVHDEHCGHSHSPVPSELAGPGGWRRGFGTIFAVGLRPCSGAILVLVFALAQGMFWAGIAATFVMGLGTAITVATIAVLAVSAKDLARPLSGAGES